ncbi:Neurexin-3b [Eumeta japonica]|uniref:Neurexin-3b n=1 Tax=Eumeta variegata TaxID=151549 RepID=A0A4C1VRH8_EUMVA|nr:Neurexin-3b [Eumeta japonica]
MGPFFSKSNSDDEIHEKLSASSNTIVLLFRSASDETAKNGAPEGRRRALLRGAMGGAGTLAWLLALSLAVRGLAFVLSAQTPYSVFRKWHAGLNGTLELEFKTEKPDGLVLYTDDGGTYDFLELKLVGGALRLRYNLGGGAQIITVGNRLNDGHWHKVQVARRDEYTTLTVDGESQSRSSRGKEFAFGKFATNSDVFVGGIPPTAGTFCRADKARGGAGRAPARPDDKAPARVFRCRLRESAAVRGPR